MYFKVQQSVKKVKNAFISLFNSLYKSDWAVVNWDWASMALSYTVTHSYEKPDFSKNKFGFFVISHDLFFFINFSA